MSELVIRAVDLGYGNVKYTVSAPPARAPVCAIFPSLAPVTDAAAYGEDILERADTAHIRIGETTYEVGPDVELNPQAYRARVLAANYIGQPEYLALLRGALCRMNVAHIDLLVLGLPLSLLAKKRAALQALAESRHVLQGGRQLPVRRALVIAQPLGGLVDYTIRHPSWGLAPHSKTLVIDPGMWTVDWLTTRGATEIPQRSGSESVGMHVLLERIAQSVSRVLDEPYEDLARLDQGLRTRRFQLAGRPFDLRPHVAEAQRGLKTLLNRMSSSIGDARDIDRILLVGGGTHLYAQAVNDHFPDHPVAVAPDPVFANVRGFLEVGRRLAPKICREA